MKTRTLSSIGGFAVGGIATLSLAFGQSQAAQAATIGLYNTGVDGSGNALANGTADSHYSLTGPSGAIGTLSLSAPLSYPIGNYNAAGNNVPVPTGKSTWIGPNNTSFEAVPGTYTYRTTFDLTGLNANTANITGKWTTDNSGVDIRLNGLSIGNANGNTNPGFNLGGLSSFTLPSTSNFLATNNILEFIVLNDISGGLNPSPTNPVALRVELSGTADAVVPEPSDLLGTAIAFGSVVVLKRKLGAKTDDLDRVSM